MLKNTDDTRMKTIISNEERIAKKALENLEEQSGLTLLPTEINSVLGTGLWPDMRLRLKGTKIDLISEIKCNASPANLHATVKQLNTAAQGRTPMLIADYIDQKMGHELRKLKINYLDAGGNAYLHAMPYYVLIEGRPKSDLLRHVKPPKAFTPIDLQVIFALLANPGLLQANYREIADHANVALGAFGTAFRELKDQGFLVESSHTHKREWRARHKLIGRWVEQYPKLKTKHYLGPFCTANSEWWRSAEMSKYDAHLGGDFAAASYTKYANSETSSIYLDDHQQWKFIREMHFVKASTANKEKMPTVKIFSKFWGKTELTESSPQITHPLITYADLIDSGNPNSMVAANQIAEQYFA